MINVTINRTAILLLGKIEGRHEKGAQRMRWLDGIIETMYMNLSKLWEIEDRETWLLQSLGSQRVGYNLATKQHCFTWGLSPNSPGNGNVFAAIFQSLEGLELAFCSVYQFCLPFSSPISIHSAEQCNNYPLLCSTHRASKKSTF